MTTFFNRIVPRLSRTLGRETAPATGPTGETGFSVKPAYEIKETADAWGLTAHLPGVTKDSRELTAEEGLITIRGRRTWRPPAGPRSTASLPTLPTCSRLSMTTPSRSTASMPR